MSELRFNPFSEEWVIVAVERATRPESFSTKPVVKAAPKAQCPFCYGYEDMTPPEVHAVAVKGRERLPNTPDWQMRVVPNKFSALSRDIIPDGQFLDMASCSTTTCLAYGYGSHEVVISSPAHDKTIGQLEQPQVELIVETYQRRYRVLAKDKLVKYIQIICNNGKEGGASLEHPHSQIFAMPIVPKVIQTEIGTLDAYWKKNKKCLMCETVEEARKRDLIVYENEAFVVFCPLWAKMPFETWIVPKAHEARFEDMTEPKRQLFTKSLRMLLQKIYMKLNGPPYNYYIHTAPVSHGEDKPVDFHWHLEFVARLNTQAGLEYGSGVFINTMVPEKAAEFLR